MEPNVCREVFKDSAKSIYCDALPEYLHVGDQLNPTGKYIVKRSCYTVNMSVQYLPVHHLGIVVLECAEIYGPQLEEKGFPHKIMKENIRNEAELIRAAILYFDNYVEAINQLSPYDETDVGEYMPATVAKQAA